MKNKIHYSVQSQKDLDAIWDYIATEYQNVSAASKIVNSILDDVDQLEDFAELGPELSSIADVENDYRFLVTKDYLTFYRVSGENIFVDRVLNGRMDYLRVLREGTNEEYEYDL